jgi:peptide deformylase
VARLCFAGPLYFLRTIRGIIGFSAAEAASMAIRTVLQLGDPGLREIATRVQDPAAQQILALIEDLSDTLAYWKSKTGYGRAIAAPQIGAAVRVIFLQLPGAEPWPFVNPEITERSEEKIVVWDACLSFLSIFMQVERNREITVRYQDLHGEWHQIQAGEERNLSELLQHEIDHLDGILAVDRITDIRTMCTREEFEKRYRAHSPYAATTLESSAGR